MAVDSGDSIFLFFIFLSSALIFFLFHWSKKKPVRSPPSPLALPLLGHFHLLSSALPKSLEALARRYGPLMQISIGSSHFLVASDATTAQQILRAHDVEFASKFVFAPSHHNIYKEAEFVNAPYGTYWKFMKRLCMTQLFAGPQIDRFSHIREDETMKLLRSLWKCHQVGEPCDLGTKLTAMSNNMLCRMAMSRGRSKSDDQAHEIREIVRDTMACGARLSFAEVHGPLKHIDLFGNGRRLRTALRRFDVLVEQIIKEYEDASGQASDEKDVMDILLETYRDPNAEIRLTRDQIKHFFLDLLIAGVDTTSASMQWAIIELLKHPPKLKKLREEIDMVVGSTRLVNESDVANLPYLQAVVKETLRLHTPGPLLRRKCNSDCEINGYDIKAGTNILINAYAIMHDPGTWKDPDEFVPERFLAGDGDDHRMELKGQDFHFLPFGSGRRACIGVNHAAIVLHTVIGGLIQCFDLKGAEKVDIKLATGYSGATVNPLVCYPIGLLNPTVLPVK
ncbi:hypothetical protein BT93_A1980 [Corymbia citriodora subsp. variegata]|nr:hypothetical protein BT93_A1980 [Corymbia citriodora subsp. variegata]